MAWKKPTASRMARASSELAANAKAFDNPSTPSAKRRCACFLASGVFSAAAHCCCLSSIHSMAPAIMASRSPGVPPRPVR